MTPDDGIRQSLKTNIWWDKRRGVSWHKRKCSRWKLKTLSSPYWTKCPPFCCVAHWHHMMTSLGQIWHIPMTLWRAEYTKKNNMDHDFFFSSPPKSSSDLAKSLMLRISLCYITPEAVLNYWQGKRWWRCFHPGSLTNSSQGVISLSVSLSVS